MAAYSKDYRYSVEFNIHAVDAPGTRLTRTGDIYLNICMLGMHKRSRLLPPYLPMHVDQKLYFEKVFKFCVDSQDIIQRLEREHVLIELIQNVAPSPVVLASYEVVAKDFLYPYLSNPIEYTGLRRYVLLTRTIDFPGISPSFEFSTSPTVDDITGLSLGGKTTGRQARTAQRPRSPSWRPSSPIGYRSLLNSSGNMSRSVTSHTISSAVKNDYGQRDTQEKLRELAVDRDINYVRPIDRTRGRPPFVVRHVNTDLIGRKPKSHRVMSDGLVINAFTLARADSPDSLDGALDHSRSLSPVIGRSIDLTRSRARSPSPVRHSPKLSQSADFERARSPSRYLSNDDDDYRDSNYYSTSLTRSLLSPTLHRESFRSRYRYSPATDLSGKVINTLQRNLDSYVTRPWYRYYPSYPYYSLGYSDADDILARSRRLSYVY